MSLSPFFSLSVWGPSIKYVTLFWTNFDPSPSVKHCHTSRDPSPKVRHASRNPQFFSSTCIHTYVFTGNFVLVCGGSCPGCFVRELLSGRFCSGCFCLSLFCQNTSVTTES